MNLDLRKAVLWLVWLSPLILFSLPIFSGRALFWGTVSLQFVPWRHLAWEELVQGSFPLWNPYLGTGAPLLANYQSALLYPPNWMFFLLEAVGGLAWSTWGIAVLAAAHLIWASLGMARLVRGFGASPLAQAVSGAAFGLSGYLVGRVGFFSLLTAAAWLPWVIDSAIRSAHSIGMHQGWSSTLRHSRRLSVLTTMQLLAGHAQISWYTLVLAGVITLWIAYRHNPTVGESLTKGRQSLRLKRGIIAGTLLLGASIIALLLSAAQILPTAEYLAQSQRLSQVGYEFAMTYSFWPWRFLTLLAPGMFGSPVSGDYWGFANFWEDHVYIGLLPVMLVTALVIGELRSWLRGILMRRRQRVVSPSAGQVPLRQSNLSSTSPTGLLIGITVAAFVLALGDRTPFFPWLYRHVPTFDMFQAPTRFSIWAVFAMAWMAGVGVDRWHRPEGRSLYWSRLAVAGAAAITLGSGITWLLLQDVSPTFIRATAIAGMWGIGIGVLNLLAPVKNSLPDSTSVGNQPALWALGVINLLCMDLISAGWGLNPSTETTFYTRENPVAQEMHNLVGARRLYLPAEDEYALKFERFMRFDTFDPGEDWQNLREMLLPNLILLDGLSTVNNFDPLLQRRYVDWIELLENPASPATRQKLLNLAGVGAVENISATSGLATFEIVEGGQRVRWVTCAISVATSQDAWRRLAGGQFDPNREVVLEGITDPELECSFDESVSLERVSQLDLVVDEPGRVVIHSTTSSSGWMVLADAWYPGWTARVDGQIVPILRANYLFRAVQLPAGEHETEFIYRPLSFSLGLSASAITWIVLLISLFLRHRRS